jgi:hypothetical protein
VQELDFEDLRQPHIYQLLVTATEDSGGFSTSVELTIRNNHNFTYLSLLIAVDLFRKSTKTQIFVVIG